MVEVPTLTSISAHANPTPSAAPDAAKAAAKKTANLLAAWHALTPTQRDQPAALEQPLSKPSAVPKSGLDASGSAAVGDTSQAAQKAQALLVEWRRACSQQEPSKSELNGHERLQHQISKQQGEVLLSHMTSLEYGR